MRKLTAFLCTFLLLFPGAQVAFADAMAETGLSVYHDFFGENPSLLETSVSGSISEYGSTVGSYSDTSNLGQFPTADGGFTYGTWPYLGNVSGMAELGLSTGAGVHADGVSTYDMLAVSSASQRFYLPARWGLESHWQFQIGLNMSTSDFSDYAYTRYKIFTVQEGVTTQLLDFGWEVQDGDYYSSQKLPPGYGSSIGGAGITYMMNNSDEDSFFDFCIEIEAYASTPNPNPVPEPTTILLFGTGLIGLAGIGRRKFR